MMVALDAASIAGRLGDLFPAQPGGLLGFVPVQHRSGFFVGRRSRRSARQ